METSKMKSDLRTSRKMKLNETVIYSVVVAVTLMCMNLRFGVYLSNSKLYQQAATTPNDFESSASIVFGEWKIPDQCPKPMLESALASKQQAPIPKVSNPRFDSFVVAMIATGKASDTKNVERSIQSLRRRGQYDGRIVVITERDGRYSSLEEADDQITVVRVDNSTLHFELKEKMPFKRLKSQVIDLMDTRKELDSYTHVIYIDIDIVIGDRIDDFFGYVEQRIKRAVEMYGDSRSFMMMFEEQGGGIEKAKHRKKLIWHSGVSVFHRQHSRRCLDIWREVIDLNRFKRDQTCLYYMYYSNPEMRQQCDIVRMDDKAYFYIPTQETMEQARSAVFVHNTNTGRAKRIHKKTQYDYYRCAMMLDDGVVLDDLTKLERKKKVMQKEEKAGLVWDGLELKEKQSEDAGDSNEKEDDKEELDEENSFTEIDAEGISVE